jgi:hypothetical protein
MQEKCLQEDENPKKGLGKIVSHAFGVNSELASAIRGFVPYWGGA